MKIAKVLLTKTIESVGYVGEVVDVADGYARNYLLPHHYAAEPTQHNINKYADDRAAHEREMEKRHERATRLADELSSVSLTFMRKVHDDNKLYGSVSSHDIASKIEEETGEHIEHSRIRLDHSIEEAGQHVVTISLYKDISVDIHIMIEQQTQQEE